MRSALVASSMLTASLLATVALAGSSPKGACLQANQKTRSDAYGKCNKDFDMKTKNDERRACLKTADDAFRTEQDRCMTLSDTPEPAKKK